MHRPGESDPSLGRGLDPAPDGAGAPRGRSPLAYAHSTVPFPFTDACQSGVAGRATILDVATPVTEAHEGSAIRDLPGHRATSAVATRMAHALAPHLTPTLALVIRTRAYENSFSDNQFRRTRVA